jgi:hypothetical protein
VHQRWRLYNSAVAVVDSINPLNRSYNVHVVMGGYNLTHYFNDVWLGTQRVDAVYEDIEWRRLPDAPFSPRANMQTRWMAARTWDNTVNLPWTDVYHRPFLRVIGGQTGHACGLRELGHCSAEIWMANLTLAV